MLAHLLGVLLFAPTLVISRVVGEMAIEEAATLHWLNRRIDSYNCTLDTDDVASRLLKYKSADPGTMLFYHGDFRQDAFETACDNLDLNDQEPWSNRPSLILPMVYHDFNEYSGSKALSPFDLNTDPNRCYRLSDRKRELHAVLSMTYADMARDTVYYVWDGAAPMFAAGVGSGVANHKSWRSQWDEFIYPVLYLNKIKIKVIHPKNRIVSDYVVPTDSLWYHGAPTSYPDNYKKGSTSKAKRETIDCDKSELHYHAQSSLNTRNESSRVQARSGTSSATNGYIPGEAEPVLFGPFCTSQSCRQCTSKWLEESPNTELAYAWGRGIGFDRGMCSISIVQQQTCSVSDFPCQDLVISVQDNRGNYIGSTNSRLLSEPKADAGDDVPTTAVTNAVIPYGTPWRMINGLPWDLLITTYNGSPKLSFSYNKVTFDTQMTGGALSNGVCTVTNFSGGKRKVNCNFSCL